MKVLFLGTPEFSAVVLRALAAKFDVVAAVTNPDRPSGRGYALRPSPLKECAASLGIPVLQYEKVSREGIDEVAALGADIAVTAAFGQILSEKFISLFPHGVLNVHASLLPRYRGASPIQWAVLNGDEYSGVSIMRTVREVDAGDVLLQKKVKIGERETAGELFDRLAVLGGEAICEALSLVESGAAVYTPQNPAEATFCHFITKADGKMDFRKTVRQTDCFVRGMSPWPSAYVIIGGKRVKVLETTESDNDDLPTSRTPGEVLTADPALGLTVACADGAVRLCRIQPEGKAAMSDCDYLRGNRIAVGTVLE